MLYLSCSTAGFLANNYRSITAQPKAKAMTNLIEEIKRITTSHTYVNPGQRHAYNCHKIEITYLENTVNIRGFFYLIKQGFDSREMFLKTVFAGDRIRAKKLFENTPLQPILDLDDEELYLLLGELDCSNYLNF